MRVALPSDAPVSSQISGIIAISLQYRAIGPILGPLALFCNDKIGVAAFAENGGNPPN